MKKADFEIEFYRFIPKTKDMKILIDMRKACQKRIDELAKEEREKEKLKHEKAIKKLNPGSKVIVKFYELAGEIVEIVKHNPKYTQIKRANGEIWDYPRDALGFVDSHEDKLTVKTNREVNKRCLPLLKKVLKGELGGKNAYL